MVPIIDPFLRIKEKKVIRFYLVLWGCTGVFPLLLYVIDSPFNEHNWMYTFYHFYGYIGYFILGYYFKRFGDETRLLKLRSAFIFIALSISLMGIYFFVFDCPTVLVSDYKGLPIILYSIAMFCFLKKLSIYICNNRVKKFITSLSVYSFGIYLFHMLIVMFIYPIIPIVNEIPDLAITAMFVLINIAVSYIIVYFMSKSRYLHYILG